jgi:zinc transport system substrate-binding protein
MESVKYLEQQKMMNKYITIVLLSLPLFLLSCGRKQSSNGEKAIITVTIEPQRYFAEAIAGNKFKIHTMVPKGVSPETYDPTPKQIIELKKSKAYLQIGYIGFEQVWMKRLINDEPNILVFNTSKGINLIREEEHQDKTKAEESHSGVEPHIWNSPKNALIIAFNTYKAFCQLDPKNESYYKNRYDSLCTTIKNIDNLIHKYLDSKGGTTFMIYHPALSYFARDYNLRQISIEYNGKEPSPTYLSSLIKTCKKEKVKVIFIQKEFDQRNAEIIANETKVKVIPINPLSYDWDKEMLNIATELRDE